MAWLYKRGGVWWIGYRVNGWQILRSTEQEKRSEAVKQLEKIELLFSTHKVGGNVVELAAILAGKPQDARTLVAALDVWIEGCRGTTARETCERYEGVAGEFRTFTHATAAAPLLRDVNEQHVRDFLAHKRAKTSAATANLVRNILRAFFTQALPPGAANPAKLVPRLKADRQEVAARRPFTLAEFRLIVKRAPSDFWRYMVLAGFYTGQRMGDLICLTAGSVDFGENVIRIRQRKTDKAVSVPMAAPLRMVLQGMLRERPTIRANTHLWPAEAAEYLARGSNRFSQEFHSEILAPLGLVAARDKKKAKQGREARRETSSVSFHCFRHTFVSMLKLTGANQSIAKELAGHTSDAVNQLYTHLPQAALQEAVNQLPGV